VLTPDLASAVAAAASLDDLLGRLGLDPRDQRARRRIKARVARSGVATSHWTPVQRAKYSRNQLGKAVAASVSYAGVLRHLGLAQAGGTQARLARRIRAEGIDTSHFTSRAPSGTPPSRLLTPAEVLVVLPPGSARRKTKQLRRALEASGVPAVCDCCGIGPIWHGRELTLVIDHRNGDWLDNRLDNLRYLCPNCHSQTATWCRRKMGP